MRFVFKSHIKIIREVKATGKHLELKCHAKEKEMCMPCVGYW
jgi:hypothetical protein